MNEYWKGGGLRYQGVKYNIGPSPANTVLNLVNEQDYVTTPMWNVIGIINGTILDEVVVVGNHRDAWIAGGAGDPNSGSAALNEVIRSFGKALELGWKPLRTIVFCSWDGEEYGLIGSTEWVEEYLPWLSKTAVAYLNVDVGAVGPEFEAAASPLLNNALYEATSLVQSPNQTLSGQTVRDTWDGHIRTMGSGSDFTAFQDFAGIPSVDMNFKRSSDSPVYHYHSNYDSFDWMDRFGDPGWHYHTCIAKVWALLAAKLIEAPVIRFKAADYSKALKDYLDSAKDSVRESGSGSGPVEDQGHHHISFSKLDQALHELHDVAVKLDDSARNLENRLKEDIPWWKWWERVQLFYEVRKANGKYLHLERQFLHADGLDGRPWFKHVVFAPGLWTGYSGATFPGLLESISDKEWVNAQVRTCAVSDYNGRWLIYV